MAGVRRRYIREQTRKLLAEYEIIVPPVDVEKLAQSLGLQVRYQYAEDSLSGFLVKDANTGRNIIGVNNGHSLNRKRFTIAHEIGHYILHEKEFLHVDRTNADFQIRLRNEEAHKGTDVDEIEANLFAAEILMPADFLQKDLVEIGNLSLQEDNGMDKLDNLAKKYGVSFPALNFRLINLGYIEGHS